MPLRPDAPAVRKANRPSPGRPPGPTGKARESVLRLRAHKAEIAHWRDRAESEGVSLSEWVRGRLNGG